jgi:hypothetical protein
MGLAPHLHHLLSLNDEDASWLSSIGICSEPGGCRANLKRPDGRVDSRWFTADAKAEQWLIDTMQPGDDFELRAE